MSDSHEPSYYEIALTNRQVLVAFVMLMLCILGAFLGGVWLGRDNPRGGEQLAESTLAEGDVPDDLDGVDEFKFFSERDQDAAVEPSPDRPLAEDVGSAAPGSLVTPPPPPSPPPRTTPPPPPPPPPPPRPTAPPPSPPPADTATATGFVVQVFSTANEARARELVARLRKGGEQAFLSPVAVSGQTMYRVRIGPFPNRPAAEKVQAKIERHYQDLPKPWVTDAHN